MIKTIRLLIGLRWIAIGLQLLALATAIALKLPVNVPLFLFALGIQVVVNWVTYATLSHRRATSDGVVFGQLVMDLISLNLFMVAAGGLANPLSGLFVIQAVVAAMILSGYRLLLIIVATGLSYAILTLSFDPSCQDHSQWMAFHIPGMVLNHLITTAAIGFFVVRIVQNLRATEHRLSAKYNLIGAGVTAAQLAHKLGSPLTAISMIIDDLEPDTISHDQARLQSEMIRAKTYLTSLFQRLHRLDHAVESQPIADVVSTVINDLRRFTSFTVTATTSQDFLPPTAAELIALLLDILGENAAEAGATQMAITWTPKGDYFVLTVSNNGPPLPAELTQLMILGFSNNKGLHHTGIGLFLAKLVLDNLGASVQVDSQSGVTYRIMLPKDGLV